MGPGTAGAGGNPTPPAGLLANIRESLADSDAEWAEAGWTCRAYACTPGEETVLTKADIDTYQPVLALQALEV